MRDIIPLLPLKTEVPTYGTIEGVLFTGGERYYWLRHPHGTISLMPEAFVLDHLKMTVAT